MSINLNNLENRIIKLPSEIFDAENKYNKANHELEKAELEFEIRLSHAIIEAKGENAQTKKAHAVIATETYRRKVLTANLEAERMKAYLNAKKAEFDGARKVAGLESELLRYKLTGN